MNIELNAEQAAAVNSNHPHTVVIAGPGSGKSSVLVERVLELIRRGVDPESIVIIAYTNASADLLRERIEKALAEA